MSTLCDPMDCIACQAPVFMEFSSKNTGVGSRSLLQGIFPAQGLNQVSHVAGRFFTIWATKKPKNTVVDSLSLLQGIFLTQELNWSLLHCRRILYQLSFARNVLCGV